MNYWRWWNTCVLYVIQDEEDIVFYCICLTFVLCCVKVSRSVWHIPKIWDPSKRIINNLVSLSHWRMQHNEIFNLPSFLNKHHHHHHKWSTPPSTREIVSTIELTYTSSNLITTTRHSRHHQHVYHISLASLPLPYFAVVTATYWG